MLDIVDRDLSVIIPNIDYKKIGLSKSNDFFSQFSYFIVINDKIIFKKNARYKYQNAKYRISNKKFRNAV